MLFFELALELKKEDPRDGKRKKIEESDDEEDNKKENQLANLLEVEKPD